MRMRAFYQHNVDGLNTSLSTVHLCMEISSNEAKRFAKWQAVEAVNTLTGLVQTIFSIRALLDRRLDPWAALVIRLGCNKLARLAVALHGPRRRERCGCPILAAQDP
jgi:hypothetical protein